MSCSKKSTVMREIMGLQHELRALNICVELWLHVEIILHLRPALTCPFLQLRGNFIEEL